MNCFITDSETTGLLGSTASEIIEMHWLYCDSKLNVLDEYEFKSRVKNWNVEAESIHHILELDAMTYPAKHVALESFLQWLSNKPKKLPVYMYVRKNNELGSDVFFDMAALRLHFLDCGRLYDFYNYFNSSNFYTVLDTVSKMNKDGVIDLPKRESGRDDLRQKAVYKYLFNKNYPAHNAKEDCYALRQIMLKLLSFRDERTKNNTKWNQTSFA